MNKQTQIAGSMCNIQVNKGRFIQNEYEVRQDAPTHCAFHNVNIDICTDLQVFIEM